MKNVRINPHTWLKISGMSWKCAACGLLKEITVEPRVAKYQLNRQITKFYMNGIELSEKPKCIF